MASFQEQLRQRLAQITDNADAQTTWEKLKQQRESNQRAALEAVSQINAQTEAYRQQLNNYAKMYNSGQVVKPAQPKSGGKKKKTGSGSLGDAFGGLAGGLGNIFGG